MYMYVYWRVLNIYSQELERMAVEQDKESDKQVLLSQVEGHKKQMLRYMFFFVWINMKFYFSIFLMCGHAWES